MRNNIINGTDRASNIGHGKKENVSSASLQAQIITAKFPLDQIQEAFDTNLRMEGVKIMIRIS